MPEEAKNQKTTDQHLDRNGAYKSHSRPTRRGLKNREYDARVESDTIETHHKQQPGTAAYSMIRGAIHGVKLNTAMNSL